MIRVPPGPYGDFEWSAITAGFSQWQSSIPICTELPPTGVLHNAHFVFAADSCIDLRLGGNSL